MNVRCGLLGLVSLVALATTTSLAAQDPPRLALIDAAPTEGAADPMLSSRLTATLRQELRRYEAFQLLDSVATADMAEMHAIEGRCTGKECLDPVGGMLGVDWVAAPEYGRLPDGRWRFAVSVWNVKQPGLAVTERTLPAGMLDQAEAVGVAQGFAQAVARALGATPLPPLGAATSGGGRLDAAAVRQRLAEGGADLSKLDLSGLDLSGVDFRRATLVGTRLAGARLPGANLFSCDLTDADLSGADLTEANLDGTTLRRTNLSHAVLYKASLFATIIEAADLTEADLRETRIIGYLKKAVLTGARLQHADIGADPGNQSMGVMRAQFVSADLSGADLTGANLYKADFSYANLRGATLAQANLRNSELIQADFSDADVTGADVAQADLAGANFSGAKGVSTLKGMAEAKNRDKAVFDAPR